MFVRKRDYWEKWIGKIGLGKVGGNALISYGNDVQMAFFAERNLTRNLNGVMGSQGLLNFPHKFLH